MTLTRREFLGQAARVGAVAAVAPGALLGGGCLHAPGTRPANLSASEDGFLDELSRAAFRFFVEAAHPQTGQVLDRRLADGQPDSRGVASIAATGFGLTALCIGEERGWASPVELGAQVLRTLRHLRQVMPEVHGFRYHFVDWSNGQRIWDCELSSIDTTLLLCGVLACRAHFADPEIRRLATEVYEAVDWPWMLNRGRTFSMGWFPEKGFLKPRWDHYCELMMLNLLALGSPTHPVAPETWGAWSRPVREYYGERFIWSPAPLFVHQYSHAWFDFRDCRPEPETGLDWFENSVAATRAHLEWSLDRQGRFPWWSEDLWGVTSSDSKKGYAGWGGPPDSGPLDGTLVPCAAAGSLPFLPSACLRTLRHQRERYGDRIWRRYGFVDAFNPHIGWVNPDVLGIDLGITLLMAENLRSGFVWRTMGRDPAVRRGMALAGLRRT